MVVRAERFLDALATQSAPRVATPETITQELVTRTLGEVFPEVTDTMLEEWRPAHADQTWANVTGPEFCMIDWEDWGMAPRGLDAATLWGHSLAVPALTERVWSERRPDLEQVRPADGSVLLREGRRAARAPRGFPAGAGQEGSCAGHC